MRNRIPIAVTSRSFSANPILRAVLLERYSDVLFNEQAVFMSGEALVQFARGRRKLIVGLERLDQAVLAALPELRGGQQIWSRDRHDRHGRQGPARGAIRLDRWRQSALSSRTGHCLHDIASPTYSAGIPRTSRRHME